MRILIGLLALVMSAQPSAPVWGTAPDSDWQSLFNGRDLDGWVVKFAHHDLGDNYADTFRVQDGAIRVIYDKYREFGARFGHLFYKQKFSHYVLSLEYRFFGDQITGGPSYARLNSGVMVHSQAPETILKDQDWPISVEAQFLAGNRTTMNVCTPGTEIEMNGAMVKAHCTNLHVTPVRGRRMGGGAGGGAGKRTHPASDRRQGGPAVRASQHRRRRRHRL